MLILKKELSHKSPCKMSTDCSISGQNSYDHYSSILCSLKGHLHGYKKNCYHH